MAIGKIKGMNGTQEYKRVIQIQVGVPVRWLGIVIAVLLAGSITLPPADAMVGKPASDITCATWLNSAPLRMVDLHGKVVMVEFWTFGCYNCRNVEPYVKQWYRQYMDQGFIVIGVHSPGVFTRTRSGEREAVYDRA